MDGQIILRTDRVLYCEVVKSALVDVESPREGALTIGYRVLDQDAFFEVTTVAKLKALKVCKVNELDPYEESEVDTGGGKTRRMSTLDQLIAPLQFLGAARRAVCEVHGLSLNRPADILERLAPSLASEVGSKVISLSVLPSDPFVPGGSTR
jgi:hypothetical protein